jgi:hypothetical protein
MKIKVPKNITLPKFIDWIKANTNCEVRINQKRLEILVFADNIEKNKCVPLIAYMDGSHLMISELADDYYRPQDAWQALDNNADTYPPESFYEWVKDQYLTAKDVKVERIF